MWYFESLQILKSHSVHPTSKRVIIVIGDLKTFGRFWIWNYNKSLQYSKPESSKCKVFWVEIRVRTRDLKLQNAYALHWANFWSYIKSFRLFSLGSSKCNIWIGFEPTMPNYQFGVLPITRSEITLSLPIINNTLT